MDQFPGNEKIPTVRGTVVKVFLTVQSRSSNSDFKYAVQMHIKPMMTSYRWTLSPLTFFFTSICPCPAQENRLYFFSESTDKPRSDSTRASLAIIWKSFARQILQGGCGGDAFCSSAWKVVTAALLFQQFNVSHVGLNWRRLACAANTVMWKLRWGNYRQVASRFLIPLFGST